ncbi:hypothetical protein DL98DRAFT_420136, partial [Cadophora sp. DSE1049]
MIEVLAAIALAGNILEFTRLGISLLNDTRELYKSAKGSLSVNDQLELITIDLEAFVAKLRESNPGTSIENSFQALLTETQGVAKQLLDRLEGLKSKDSRGRKWESFRKAIKGAWTRDEIEELTKKLSRFKDALILSSLLENTVRMKTQAAFVEGIQDQMDTLVLLVRRNYEARSDEHHHARRTIAQEIAGETNEITARFEMLSVSEVHERKLRHDIDTAIIQNLAYSSMTERYENITEAFPKTFDWIFEPSTGVQPKWSNFSEWLKTGSGIYWIAGKAGSGKSTLMRYIYEDERTRDYLKSWAKSSGNSPREAPLSVATFFFWLSGTPMQKSEIGLLRALLHQVLSSCPQLGSVAFPDIWSKNYSNAIDGVSSDWINALPLKRLRSALQRVAQQTKMPVKIFFLVDGLDEFVGDHEELATLFKLISQSSMIKICVSSRPWIIFEQIYGLRPSLRLQDLTEGDISYYVNSKFDSSVPFQRLRSIQPEIADLLRDEVIEKAEGVFLWVQIVVDSLLTGIRNEDDMAILRQRLTAMPPKLE